MPIVFEEVTGEVLPERRSEEPRESAPTSAMARRFELEEGVRHIVRRDRCRAERLSDR